MLEVKNLSFSYERPILENINLQLNSGEILGLMAPSGYGKSTLGKIISGYLKQDKGQVLIDGKKIEDFKSFRPVQMVHQNPEKSVNIRWKVDKILNEGWKVSEDVKEKLGIENFWLEKWPTELSGGELQRICIARILSPQTKYLIADEITTMVDAITQVQLLEVLRHFAKKHGMGILFITHNKDLINIFTERQIDLRQINKINIKN